MFHTVFHLQSVQTGYEYQTLGWGRTPQGSGRIAWRMSQKIAGELSRQGETSWRDQVSTDTLGEVHAFYTASNYDKKYRMFVECFV